MLRHCAIRNGEGIEKGDEAEGRERESARGRETEREEVDFSEERRWLEVAMAKTGE